MAKISCAARLAVSRAIGHCALVTGVVFLLIGCFGASGNRSISPRESARYSHLLHDRFYEAWAQPKEVVKARGKISVPVDVRIDGTGRVLDFRPARLSGYRRIDASIAAVGRRVKTVPPPPNNISEFRLRIYFDLDVNER